MNILDQPVTITLPLHELLALAIPASRAAAAIPVTDLADGEIYVGTTLHEGRPHSLILLPGSTKADWKAAGEWARAQGGMLPSRHDGLVLFTHARAHFERDWYWLDEQHADAPQYAWCQNLYWGDQFNGDLSFECRARAVRRVPIQPFNDSPIPRAAS